MKSVIKIFLVVVLLNITLTDNTVAQTPSAKSGLPLPRFVSLRHDVAKMRTGPGVRYPVDWVYKRLQMPMEVIHEFGTWRKVRDFQGTEGWMHLSQLSNKRSIAVTGQTRNLRSTADSTSPAVARVEPGSVGKIDQCKKDRGWCKVSFGEYEGWLRRAETWGTYPDENIK